MSHLPRASRQASWQTMLGELTMWAAAMTEPMAGKRSLSRRQRMPAGHYGVMPGVIQPAHKPNCQGVS